MPAGCSITAGPPGGLPGRRRLTVRFLAPIDPAAYIPAVKGYYSLADGRMASVKGRDPGERAQQLGRGVAQQTALGIEYKWEPESKFARAAYADRYLPDFKGFDAVVLSTEGDNERWEIRALVSKPASVAEIAEMTRKQLVSNTPHAGSPVTVTTRASRKSNDRSEIEWKFRDDEGRGWRGFGVAEPSPEAKGKFLVTMKLARA